MIKSRYHILLIIAVGLLAYSNTFHVPFLFDDIANIAENPIIKDLHYFTDPSNASGFQFYNALRSRFIGYLSFALNYHVHGLDVVGYHIVNLVIHIVNALLVYWLAMLTCSTPYFASLQNTALRPDNNAWPADLLALFSALLFVSHPIQTQAVTYIVQRLTSLATLFYLLSLVMYVNWRLIPQSTADRGQITIKGGMSARLKSALWYLISFFTAILAMKTKEIAFTLPLMITLYELLFFAGKIKHRIFRLTPLLLTILIIPLTLISVDKPIGEIIGDVSEVTRVQSDLSRWDYLFTQFRVIVTYLQLIFLPINQNLDHDYLVYHSFFNAEVFLSFLFLLFILCLAIYLLYCSRLSPSVSRLAAFGIFWFFITLSIESSVIPITDVIFEHRMYLPSIGVFIVATTAISVIAGKIENKIPQRAKIATAILIAAILFSGATYIRNLVWQDDLQVWQDVVKKSPKNARGYTSLGFAFFTKGWIDKAIEYYQIALRLKPDYEVAHNGFGVVLRAKGLIDEAIEHYRVALRLKPDYAAVYNNLGNIYYYNKSMQSKAIIYYKTALTLNPNYTDAYYNLGYAYYDTGLKEKAIECYKAALKLQPDYVDIHRSLGLVYLEMGDRGNARNEFLIVLRLKPEDAKTRQMFDSIANPNK